MNVLLLLGALMITELAEAAGPPQLVPKKIAGIGAESCNKSCTTAHCTEASRKAQADLLKNASICAKAADGAPLIVNKTVSTCSHEVTEDPHPQGPVPFAKDVSLVAKVVIHAECGQ